MNRLRSLRILLGLLAFMVSVHVGVGAESARPNVLVILSDDMGFGEVTCYGKGSGVPTPNIDRLAREGARFTQYYTPAPICSPSRAGMISGQFPSRLRLNSFLQTRDGNRDCEQNDYLDPKAAALPLAFKHAGYATAHIGKWHMGGGRDVDDAPLPREYGYDEWATTWESPDPCPELGVQYPPWDRRLEPGQVVRHKRTEWMVNKTLDFMRRHKDQPCFVNLWPDDMHTPHRPGPEMQAKYGGSDDEKKTPRKNYLGVLEEYDRQIGRLLDGLRDSGLDKNTIVIFTCDNGPEPHFDHTRTGGLRGMKLSLYEGGTRVPFIVRWPGHIQPGASDESSVLCGVDLAPTLCRLAGIDLGTDAANLDGLDRSDVLLGHPTARPKPLLWEYGRKEKGYGYPRNPPSDKSPNVAMREDNWKLLVNDNGTSRELYNITADPKETANIAEENLAVADKLSSRAIEWRKSLPGRSHSPKPQRTSALPNLLLIVADDLGYADLGVQGGKGALTPNIDSIAKNGVRFTSGYVSCPFCAPSRAGLLSGRYNQRFGFETNNGPAVTAVPNYGVPREQRILPEWLKGEGYATGMVGKWHLGFKPELSPTQRGFDFFYGFLAGYHGYFADQPAAWSGPIQRGDKPVEEKDYLTNAFAREALSFINEQKPDKPFFLYLPFSAVHAPLQAPPELMTRFAGDPHQKTLAMLYAMDQGVGRVLDALREKKLMDNTMIVFLSDNGGGGAGEDSYNTPLRGHKGQLYEGGIRVPFLIQWNGHLPAGKVYDQAVSSLDVMPTFYAAAELLMPPYERFDGVNLLPYLQGKKPGAPHDKLYWRFYDKQKQKAIRQGDWKLVDVDGSWELFNLAQDLEEKHNLAAAHPEKVKELEELWQKWNSKMQDPKWEGRMPPPAPEGTTVTK